MVKFGDKGYKAEETVTEETVTEETVTEEVITEEAVKASSSSDKPKKSTKK